MFQEDDEETWKLLASLSSSGRADKNDLGTRLTSLAERWEEDHRSSPGDNFWNQTIRRAQKIGFRYATDSIKPVSTSLATTTATASQTPVAFESDLGKKHVQATKALLQISSDERAIQVTMSALRTIDSDGSQFQSLLGSTDLLMKTLLHHQQQRLARLGVLTECLRIEQDPDAVARNAVQSFLDSLDSTFADEDRYRGLFRRLVTIACAPRVTPSREQLEPTKALHKDHIGNSNIAQGNWNTFHSMLVQELQSQQLRERTEAMEALLVLLYERINGGVRRADYALLLLAFQYSFQFFTEPSLQSERRLAHLAGLLCAECAALWRTMDTNLTWASEHPLLLQISSSSNPRLAGREIQALQALLTEQMQAALQRNSAGDTDSPEALAALSFGLLLRLSHDSFQVASPEGDAQAIWTSFEATGLEMAQAANDQGDAFGYLLTLIEFLTKQRPTMKSSAAHDRLYDWQFSSQSHQLLLGAELISDAAPDTTAYTSIAREVLAASISTFQTVLLAIDQSNSCENIGMLSTLGASIFQNNPLLCEQFWMDWEAYLGASQEADQGPYAICKLLDSAHRLATAGLQAYHQEEVPRTFFVQTIAPFFQLLSALSHTPEIVESTIGVLPEGLIRQALLCCRLPITDIGAQDAFYQQSRQSFLAAFAKLAQVGNSESCLNRLRQTLEESTSAVSVDGPRVLARLIFEGDNSSHMVESTLEIVAHLLDGAPQAWALELARVFFESRDARASLTRFVGLGQDSAHSAALVVAELIEHMTAVVSCKSFNEHDGVTFLRCVTTSLLAATATLESSISVSSTSQTFSFETAQTIMQSVSNFLKLIRSVISLHSSKIVRQTGVEMRDEIIRALATSTGLGQAIAYYATAPVSLTLTIKLEEALEDKSILKQVAEGDKQDVEKLRKFGSWQSMLSSNQSNPMELLSKRFLLDSVGTLKSHDIDLEGITLREWTRVPDVKAALDTAWTAIRLLSNWASHVEDILATYVPDLPAAALPLEGQSRNLVESLSPNRLLTSLAIIPIPCRENSSLSAIWESAGLSNFELLQPYLSAPTDETSLLGVIPTSISLDLMHACLAHVRATYPAATVADSALFRLVYRSPHFSGLLADLIEDAIEGSKGTGDLSRKEKEESMNGLFSLSVLASCIESNATVADSMLHPRGNSIISKLINASGGVKQLVIDNQGIIFASDAEIARLRVATGCLAVLAALWQSLSTLSESQKESAAQRLVKEVKSQGAFIIDLVSIASSYAMSEDLETKYAASIGGKYARSTLTNYIALALDLLSSEVSNASTGDANASKNLENFLLRDFIRSDRFVGFLGYDLAASIVVDNSSGLHSENVDPLVVLRSFPVYAISYVGNKYYMGENSFDVASAKFWISSIGASETETEDLLVDLSSACKLVASEIRVATAWQTFSERMVLFQMSPQNTEISSERVYKSADDIIHALSVNLQVMSKIQTVWNSFLLSEAKRMIAILTGLLLYYLESGIQVGSQTQVPQRDDLLLMLSKLVTCSEIILSINISTGPEAVASSDGLCILDFQTATLMSISLLVTLISGDRESLTRDQTSAFSSSLHGLCKVACRAMQVVWSLRKREATDSRTQRTLRRATLCCVSAFTLLITGRTGSRVGDTSFFKSISAVMFENGVCDEILEQAYAASVSTSELLLQPSTKEGEGKDFSLIQDLLGFVFAIAEVGSQEMMSILPGPKLARVLVRNPLFQLVPKGEGDQCPRGYCARAGINGSTSNFQLIDDDPVHLSWRMAMRVLAACLRTSAGVAGNRHYVEMAVEFLQVYGDNLLHTLKSCAIKFTRNKLDEVSCILALVSELCRRNTRQYFQESCPKLCQEFVLLSSGVIASLSQFLSSSGTARELFDSIHRIESLEGDYDPSNPVFSQLRHPLMAEGLASAKHEAVKFSHLASRCYQRVTQDDFESSSKTCTGFASIANARETDTKLESTSRLFVTNELSSNLELAAASCVEYAISILWRMHPIQFAFRYITDTEASQMNVMSLVKTGMIIAYYPFEGRGALTNSFGGETAHASLQFGTVTLCDSVNRIWKVERLVELGPAATEETIVDKVRTGQLAGLEDPSLRKAITEYSPAANKMAQLESMGRSLKLGHLILALRWCHQESIFAQSGAVGRSGATGSAVKRLAEKVTAVLGAEISIHDEKGSRTRLQSKEASKLDAQIFELFSSHGTLANDQNYQPAILGQEGRMKDVIDEKAWTAVQGQMKVSLLQFAKEKREMERQRTEKRSFSSETDWYSGVRRKGYSQKSAFRGFR